MDLPEEQNIPEIQYGPLRELHTNELVSREGREYIEYAHDLTPPVPVTVYSRTAQRRIEATVLSVSEDRLFVYVEYPSPKNPQETFRKWVGCREVVPPIKLVEMPASKHGGKIAAVIGAAAVGLAALFMQHHNSKTGSSSPRGLLHTAPHANKMLLPPDEREPKEQDTKPLKEKK